MFGLHFDWNAILTVVVTVAAGMIRHAIKTPKDVDRARLLTLLADDAAAVVVNLAGDAPWAQLVRDVVNRILGHVELPTQNRAAIEAAATGALTRLGKSPEAPGRAVVKPAKRER